MLPLAIHLPTFPTHDTWRPVYHSPTAGLKRIGTNGKVCDARDVSDSRRSGPRHSQAYKSRPAARFRKKLSSSFCHLSRRDASWAHRQRASFRYSEDAVILLHGRRYRGRTCRWAASWHLSCGSTAARARGERMGPRRPDGMGEQARPARRASTPALPLPGNRCLVIRSEDARIRRFPRDAPPQASDAWEGWGSGGVWCQRIHACVQASF